MRVGALVLAAALMGSGTSGLSISLTAAAEQPVAQTAIAEPALVEAPSSTTTTTTSSTTSTEPPTPPIVLGFAGDVNMVRGIESQRPLDGVAHLLSGPDLMMVNLETVIGEPDEIGTPPIPKEFIFRSPPETLDQLLDAGVDVVGLANNHSWDYGPLGVTVTAAHVADSEIIGVGIGRDASEAHAPAFVEARGRTVGIASLTRVPCDWSFDETAARPEIAYACDRFVSPTFETLRSLVDGSDVAVVLVHASEELADCPSERTRQVMEDWIDFGIDVIAISHPHVLGGVERVGDGVVLWSTGNFAFQNGGGRTATSAVFEVTVAEDAVSEVRIHPTVLPGAIAAPAPESTAEAIREELTVRSPAGAIAEDGRLVADAAPSICDPVA